MSKAYKRKLPSGKISWTADFIDPATGKRKRESYRTQKLAHERLDAITTSKSLGQPLNNVDLTKATIGDMIDDYTATCLKKENEESFNRNRRFAISRFGEHFGLTTPVAEIQYRHIEDYCLMLINLPTRRGAKRANATVNREMVQIRRMFRKTKKRKIIPHNPFIEDDGDLRLPEEARNRHLSKEEFESIMAECSDHLKTIVFTAVSTGLRRSNLIRDLTWDKVDFDDEVIRMPKEVMKNKKALDVPITESLHHVLKATKKDQLRQHLAEGRRGKPPEHVFTFTKKLRGKMVTAPIRDIKTAFRAAVRRAKVDNVRFHDTRHTFGTHLRKEGIGMNMIGSLLGHSWTNVTQIYADENWERRKKATSCIEQLVADTAGTYWHTRQNGANESTVKQVSNA